MCLQFGEFTVCLQSFYCMKVVIIDMERQKIQKKRYHIGVYLKAFEV